MHPCSGSWVETERAVMYCTWAAQAFSAGIKCQHCTGVWSQYCELFSTVS